MQTVKDRTRSEQSINLLPPISQGNLAVRLARQIREAVSEFAQGPASYLRVAFLPDRVQDWLPLSIAQKLGNAVSSLARHPIAFTSSALSMNTLEVGYVNPTTGGISSFVTNANAPNTKSAKRRYKWVLAASAAIHGVLIVYL